ncbi:MAG: nucleotidyltransferase family protein [Balneolaceae bacterium]|nr:nucleotidyltransferase family protein [Balneolaceae bacterium]MCH8550199.1 nucleotidyltransferase family protein [Balneolaceae bacterium]
MRKYNEHLIESGTTIKDSLIVLDKLAKDAIAFIVDDKNKLLGSLTDGNVRRGLINGAELNQAVDTIIHPNPRFIRKGNHDIEKIIQYREKDFKIIPILDEQDRVVNILNFHNTKSYLPVDVVIMAGGKGTRLRPLTEKIPKPLLKVGDKPIIEHNISRLSFFGMEDYWISVNYLADQIETYFGNGADRNLSIEYVHEHKPLGTAGAVSMIENFNHDYVLLTNSDILTDLDYEDLFLNFIKEDADFAVVTIPYKVNVPYAVLETTNGHVMSFKEKPTYTYYSNGGIYMMKRKVIDRIPRNHFYDTTDLMKNLIEDELNVISYPHSGYWLDIGKPEDYEKAQQDIKKLNL